MLKKTENFKQPLPLSGRALSTTGFSLVELLVALTISGLVLLGVGGSFISQKGTAENEAVLRDMHVNAQAGMGMVAMVIRNAGLGCADSLKDGSLQLQGRFRSVSKVFTAVNSTTGPDTLTVASGLRSQTTVESIHADGSPVLTDTVDRSYTEIFDTNYNKYIFFAPWEDNTYLEINDIDSDTGRVTLSEEREISVSDEAFKINAYTISLDQDGSERIDVDNDGDAIDNDSDSPDPVPDLYIYNNTDDLISDYLWPSTGEVRVAAAEMAEGIEDLQFEYGWDVNEDGWIRDSDGEFVDDPTGNEDQIRAVRVHILARSQTPDPHFEDLKEETTRRYTVADHIINLDVTDSNGINSAFDHHFHRHLLVETVMVRNQNL